jgi:hypothetical protein
MILKHMLKVYTAKKKQLKTEMVHHLTELQVTITEAAYLCKSVRRKWISASFTAGACGVGFALVAALVVAHFHPLCVFQLAAEALICTFAALVVLGVGFVCLVKCAFDWQKTRNKIIKGWSAIKRKFLSLIARLLSSPDNKKTLNTANNQEAENSHRALTPHTDQELISGLERLKEDFDPNKEDSDLNESCFDSDEALQARINELTN